MFKHIIEKAMCFNLKSYYDLATALSMSITKIKHLISSDSLTCCNFIKVLNTLHARITITVTYFDGTADSYDIKNLPN